VRLISMHKNNFAKANVKVCNTNAANHCPVAIRGRIPCASLN
jgi:hypothetical protein